MSGLPGKLAPMPMSRPSEDNQIRPYLPFSRPLAPDANGPSLPGDPTMSEQARMTFVFAEPDRLLATGTIEPGTADEFRRAVQKWGDKVRTLSLHSPGGHVPDALEMAELIHARGMRTQVADDAYCASSCPLVFAAGIDRIAGAKAWIGVHQVYAMDAARGSVHDGMRDAQLVSARAQELLDEFGVDVRLWIMAMQTPKEKLYFFTSRELKAYRLATRIEN